MVTSEGKPFNYRVTYTLVDVLDHVSPAATIVDVGTLNIRTWGQEVFLFIAAQLSSAMAGDILRVYWQLDGGGYHLLCEANAIGINDVLQIGGIVSFPNLSAGSYNLIAAFEAMNAQLTVHGTTVPTVMKVWE